MAEVEEVALPIPLAVTGIPEPAAADAVDAQIVTAGFIISTGDHLFPEPDHLALLIVDDHLLIRVCPALQALHLLAECDIADLVDADAHHVFLGADVPAVGGIIGVEACQRFPVACFLGVQVGLQPVRDDIVEFLAGELRHR
ncbi:Uncharacterised protein [Mycobacteroides abscessus subsp. abscessus]|nr:Uncharacterised protein [Mycobacteroides abscessus subsp. abscessus]